MVIWLFAGGGEAEVRGLVPFLEKHFANCSFHRMTPVIRKPGPRPGIYPPGYGRTGKSLVAEIKERLGTALSKSAKCDAILVVDDLDCRDCNKQRDILTDVITRIGGFDNIDIHIGFSAPELESWIIADWNSSVACHPDFRGRHDRMRHWLCTVKKIPFDAPESFGAYDKERDCCDNKMSNAIIDSSTVREDDQMYPRYSKANHTPSLLQEIDPDIVKKKCPIFGQMIHFLNKKCKQT